MIQNSDAKWTYQSALGVLRPAYLCPDRHIYILADICGAEVDSGISPAGIYVFWPEFTPSGRHIAVLAFFGRNKSVLGRFRPFPASSGRSWAPARPVLRRAWCGPFSLPRLARPALGGPWSAQCCGAPMASSNSRLGRPSSSRSGAPLCSWAGAPPRPSVPAQHVATRGRGGPISTSPCRPLSVAAGPAP
jgi:hypothetical protein